MPPIALSNKVLRATRMLPLKLLYLDCPSRDAGGTGRRFPQLVAGVATREYCVDIATASLVTMPGEVRQAIAAHVAPLVHLAVA